MIQKFSRNVHAYYFMTLVAMLVCVLAGIRYYWVSGPVNLENVSSVFEATLQIDEIKKREYPTEIMSLVGSDRVRDAVKVLEKFEKESKDLNSVIKVSSSSQLEKDFRDLKISLNQLLSYPETSNLVSVLGNKVASFESFVVQNNWKTLSRMSRRMSARIALNQSRTKGNYTVEKLTDLVDSVVKDMQAMEEITTTSVLSPDNKTQIITKLKTFSTEVDMLAKYLTDLAKFEGQFEKYVMTYNNWMTEIIPEVSYKKIQFEKSSQNILFALMGFAGIILVALALGYFVYAYNERKQKNKLETAIIKSIKEGLIPTQNKMEAKFGAQFESEFEFYREYLHKRMSFGSIFQEAIPFSALLLDSHLNLVWANALFYENWELGEKEGKPENTYTWDTLQRFTNLGELDPILAALNEGVAGIYNIQIRTPSKTESAPFEMYVSPVEYANQKRIMIFFYPLRSMEETLSNQTKSLVGPISRSLEALSTGTFDEGFRERIKHDFEIAGISQILTKFEQYDEKIKAQKNEFFEEIERLEGAIFDQHKVIEDTKMLLKEQENVQLISQEKFEDTKKILIDIIDARGDLEALYNNTSSASKNLYKEEARLLSQAQKINELLDENVKALSSVNNLRAEFKEIKGLIEEFRTRVNHALDQSLMFKNHRDPNYKVEDSLNKIRNEMKGFDRALASFSKMNTSFDVCLSKVSLVMEDHKPVSFDEIKTKFDQARETIETDMFNVGRLMRDAEASDEEMIETLKSFHSMFVESRKRLKSLQQFLNEHEVFEQPERSLIVENQTV
jgi:hypothetical protein